MSSRSFFGGLIMINRSGAFKTQSSINDTIGRLLWIFFPISLLECWKQATSTVHLIDDIAVVWPLLVKSLTQTSVRIILENGRLWRQLSRCQRASKMLYETIAVSLSFAFAPSQLARPRCSNTLAYGFSTKRETARCLRGWFKRRVLWEYIKDRAKAITPSANTVDPLGTDILSFTDSFQCPDKILIHFLSNKTSKILTLSNTNNGH